MPQVTRRTHLAVFLALFLFASAAAALWGYRTVLGYLEPVDSSASAAVVVEVPPGSGAREVAELLQQKQLIRDATVFRYYARYKHLDSQIHSGEYELTPAMTPDQILAKLSRGEVVVHRFTVPEGLSVVEVADLLASKGIVDKQKFLEAAANAKLAEAYLPKEVALSQPLEGYLFPSTYEYKTGATAEDIVALMFSAFEQVWTPEFRQRAEERHMTVHQVMTLASIVEKEAQVAKERPIISGVYANRLEIGMKLDADPTVRYALGKPPKEVLLYKDLDVESPYNTYRNPGLPPGPIAAPGKASIQAALWPEKHDFWYFVARADGSGEHYFATTLDEQEANIALAEQNAKK